MTFWAAILPRRGRAIVAADRRMTDCEYDADGAPRAAAFSDNFGKIVPFSSGWIIDTLPPIWKGRWSAAAATVEDIGVRIRRVALSGMRDLDEATAAWYRRSNVARLLALHATAESSITLQQWAVDGTDLGELEPGVYVGVPPGPSVAACDAEIAQLVHRICVALVQDQRVCGPDLLIRWAAKLWAVVHAHSGPRAFVSDSLEIGMFDHAAGRVRSWHMAPMAFADVLAAPQSDILARLRPLDSSIEKAVVRHEARLREIDRAFESESAAGTYPRSHWAALARDSRRAFADGELAAATRALPIDALREPAGVRVELTCR